jgi:urease beta subunit
VQSLPLCVRHKFRNWSKVKFVPDKQGMALNVVKWCTDNTTDKHIRIGFDFYFKNKNDAILFKLTWG